jgi:4-amino-4-deoxy-L-arabinose transferase-like glycosyltransferase
VTAARFRLWLVVITAVGAAWRIGYLVVAKLGTPLLLNDSLYFSIQAGRNSEGDWFREGLTNLPGAEHGPLTPLYLTPWSLGSGDNVDWQRFGTTLLGIATIAVIGLAGRRLAGPRVGLVAAGIAAVYPNLWINDSLVMSETLALLLVSLALLVALDLDRRPGPWRAVLLGVIVGLATLTRSELGLLAVGFAGLAWWRAAGTPRRALQPVLVLLATALTVAPWVVYNAGRFERTVLLSTNDGTTLLGANCPRTYEVDVGGWDIRCLDAVPTNDTIDASLRSAERRDVAVDYVRDHLGRVPVVVLARVGRALDVYGLGSLVALDRGEEKAEWAVWAGIVCWWLLAIAAIFGWRRLGVDEITRRSRWWLAVPLLTVVVTTIVFYGAHRIRAPAEPAVVLLAAVAAVEAWDRVRARRVAHSPA